MIPYRIGHGYDVHRLVRGRALILCGVTLPHEVGLDGHSDADVALHALMDAMLGAAALGDIGRHFPDTDPAYRGISSRLLLRHVAALIEKHGYRVGNLDLTIVAQRPRLAPYLGEMVANLSADLGLCADCINVKATTEEHLGFTGSGEGIAAHAVCLLARSQP